MHWVAVAAVDTLACVSWLQVTSGLWATPDGMATMWPAIFDGIAAWRTVGVSAVFRRKLNKVGMAVFLRRRRPSCRPLSNWSCSKWSSQILELPVAVHLSRLACASHFCRRAGSRGKRKQRSPFAVEPLHSGTQQPVIPASRHSKRTNWSFAPEYMLVYLASPVYAVSPHGKQLPKTFSTVTQNGAGRQRQTTAAG